MYQTKSSVDTEQQQAIKKFKDSDAEYLESLSTTECGDDLFLINTWSRKHCLDPCQAKENDRKRKKETKKRLKKELKKERKLKEQGVTITTGSSI